MTTFGTLLAKFPLENIRDKQRDVLRQIADALDMGYKYVVLEAPVGFGKSAVAMTLALYLGSCYICTSTKNLQLQYCRDFARMAKGKAN